MWSLFTSRALDILFRRCEFFGKRQQLHCGKLVQLSDSCCRLLRIVDQYVSKLWGFQLLREVVSWMRWAIHGVVCGVVSSIERRWWEVWFSTREYHPGFVNWRESPRGLSITFCELEKDCRWFSARRRHSSFSSNSAMMGIYGCCLIRFFLTGIWHLVSFLQRWPVFGIRQASFACGVTNRFLVFSRYQVPDPWSFFILDTPSPDDRRWSLLWSWSC